MSEWLKSLLFKLEDEAKQAIADKDYIGVNPYTVIGFVEAFKTEYLKGEIK
jgi:hypothetical protein